MSGLLEKLEVVRLQLESSCHGISHLSSQHRDWQSSIEAMLQVIEKEALHGSHGIPSVKVTPEQDEGLPELQHSEGGLPIGSSDDFNGGEWSEGRHTTHQGQCRNLGRKWLINWIIWDISRG